MTTEEHPLEPFLPAHARVLYLGSFPPPQERWSMDFFYPNWINDFWRIQGLIHFQDPHYFEQTGTKAFHKARIVEFCTRQGIALFDTARRVCRLKDNADDNFLEIVEGTDVFALLRLMPQCHTIVTTGGKASQELQSYLEKQGLQVGIPKVGCSLDLGWVAEPLSRPLVWWRMPSSSRAYPMKLEKKAEAYQQIILNAIP